MNLVLNRRFRYIQIAFNHSLYEAQRILRQIPQDPRIIIEAGTPFCKREGMNGVRMIRRLWRGILIADLKVIDGAEEEVFFASLAGANGITVLGSSPIETLDLFNYTCKSRGLIAGIDMLGVDNPLKKMMALTNKPDFVVIHKGRDEESNKRKIIKYKDISKIRSKFNVSISVAGGLDEESVRSAYFNGADIAILNIVKATDKNKGLSEHLNFRHILPSILQEVGK
ncbi:MAG: orotidine 5'-phosphate decarboxylase / HUMPS family protein [Promethearchaeota archaeon]